MRGEVLNYDATSGEGLIAASDFLTYPFTSADVVAGKAQPGAQVDFFAEQDGRASRVVFLGHVQADPAREPLQLGLVVRRTLASIAQNWPIMLGAATILVGVPSALTVLARSGVLGGVLMLPFVLTSGLHFLGLFVLQGMVMKVTINGFNGGAARSREALDGLVSTYLPLIGLSIVAAIATTIGFLLLVIPGLILWVMWSVAAPALVMESTGILGSLQRSRDLTRGYRWPVFGLFLVYLVLSFALVLAVRALGNVVDSGSEASRLAIGLIAGPVSDVVSAVVAAAGAASLYYELRRVREGVASEDLAAVFD